MTALEPVLNNPPALSPPGELRRGALAALPVLLGFIPFALVLGAQASQHHLNAGEVALMTGLNFGGGSEFAAIELWTSPPAVLVIVAMTLLVNSRHLLMGATLAPYLRHLPLKKALGTLFFMCDESWAMGLADARQRGGFSLRYFTGVALCLWATWVGFTTLGTLLGPLLGDLRSYGFDMAFAAVFLVLLKGMWKGIHAAVPWLFSLLTATTFHLLIPGGWYAGGHAGRASQRLPVGQTMIDVATLTTIAGMAVVTYLTRALGFLLLRNRTLGPQLTQVLNAAPGCVLIAVIAPKFVSGQPADLIALALTVYAASRFSLLPAVVLAIVGTGALRALLAT